MIQHSKEKSFKMCGLESKKEVNSPYQPVRHTIKSLQHYTQNKILLAQRQTKRLMKQNRILEANLNLYENLINIWWAEVSL